MIKVTKLNKYYSNGFAKKLHVINNTTIEIPSSGIIAVIGKSGVGKSTLLNSISGLDNFKNGTIDYDGIVVNKYKPKVSDKVRMEMFGFIFQNYYLLKNKTVYQNVVQTLENFDISEEEKKERVNYVLKQLEIAKYTNKLVKNLSGGEQQRVSIARALVKSPKVIFADEPTGSLDEKTTFTVLNILKKISEKCTVFIVTHEKELISYYADYIIELNEGTVINEFVPDHKNDNFLAVDQNIYLNELKNKEFIASNDVKINLYSDNNLAQPLNIDIAYVNNKIYLQSNVDLQYIDHQTEVKLIEGDRYSIKDYVNKDFDYELKDIKYDPSKLKYKNAFLKSIKNLKTINPFKIVLRAILILITALFIVLFDNIIALKNKDLSLALNGSKGALSTNFKINDISLSSSTMNIGRKKLTERIMNDDKKTNIIFAGTEPLVFKYDGFFQYAKKSYVINNYSFRTLPFLDQNNIIYGKMPEKTTDIVIDEYVLNRFMYNNLLTNIITDYEFFIGKTVTGQNNKVAYTISGVCRTKNPVIYGYDEIHYSWSVGDVITTLEKFKNEYPEYANITLGEMECLSNANTSSINYNFTSVGKFDKAIPYKMVIRSEDLLKYKLLLCTYGPRIIIETNGSNEEIEYCYNLTSEIENENMIVSRDLAKKMFIIETSYPYEESYEENTKAAANVIKILSIISIIFGVISIIFVIITSNKSMTEEISEIAIYRSLGYPKLYTKIIYMNETIINILLHTLIGGLITFLILLFVSSVPIFDYAISINIGLTLLIIMGIALINIIIGIIPIEHLLNKSPTQIYNTYSRKIES